MSRRWAFDLRGPAFDTLAGPVPLAPRGMGLPARPGLYIVASGGCLSHVGTSGGLRGRVGSLANLRTHRGSPEVLCGAFCTGVAPVLWWEAHGSPAEARERERQFKGHYGEPPQPRDGFAGCVNGGALLAAIVGAAGPDSWEAGYAEAVITIGEKLRLLFQPRFQTIWRQIGVPPGPWAGLLGST